jgi:PAS domain-containing protein
MLSRFARFAALVGHARARNLLVACGLLIGLVLGGTAAWIIVDLHSDHLAHEKQDLTNLAFILSEEMYHEIQGIDLLQLSLIGHMRQLGIQSPESFEQEMRSFEVHQDLSSRIAGLPHIAALSLQDRNGNLINFSRSWPAPSINVRDRDFTRVLLAANAPKTFISEPSLSQTTGKWTIYFSRRFESPDGQLIGIVLSTVLTDHFEHLFSQIALDGEASLTLYRSDGMLLVRHPQVVPQIGKTFSQTGNYNRMLGALDGGIARFTSTLDNKERLVAGHTVAHYPLIVTASSTVDEVLEPWREEAAALGVVTVFLELVLAITVLLAVRHLRGYELLQAAEAAQARAEEHERGAVALQLQGQRFDIALNNMLQALLMFDHAGRLLVANQRMYGMFGMPDGALMPGMTYREVTDRVIEAGQVTAEDMENMRGRRAGLIARNERVSTIWELASGRVFNVTHQPMDDGWLATFEDITERRRTEARMAHLAHHDALTDLPNRVLFRKRLEDALTSARRGEGLALLALTSTSSRR